MTTNFAPAGEAAVSGDSMEVLHSRIAALAEPTMRGEAATALARAMCADDLLIFVRDEETGVMVTAPGFIQTLPEGRRWRAFLADCVAKGEHTGRLPLRAGEPDVSVTGHAVGAADVIVVVGRAKERALASLVALLPLLASLFRGERAAAFAELKATQATAAAARAGMLASTLDLARLQLEAALAHARESRNELESANLLLHDQAAELEAQAEELQVTAAQLEERTEEAERANRAKSEFLAVMSHELRTPLNAIDGYAELLQLGIPGKLSPAQSDFLARIRKSQRHLLGLINGVLNYARIEAGGVHFARDQVPIQEALVTCEALIAPQALAKGIDLAIESGDPAIAITADGEKLQQILLNLLTNATKFTERGGRIGLSWRTTEKEVFISVSDTGRGIAADQLSRVFEPFVQLDAQLTRRNEGVGLGLAISRDLARGMGGDITVESRVGAGSLFTLMLPRA